MRIGIDYTSAVRQGGGIGRYTRNLVRTLAKLDVDNQYLLFVAGGWGDGDGMGPWPHNFRVCPVPLSDRWLNILWHRLRIPVPIQLFTGRLDLFHSPDFVLPPTRRAPTILTVHDLSFLRVPQYFVPAFQRYLEAAVQRAVKRSDFVLADSESTRRDLVELTDLGAANRQAVVVYPGVEGRFTPVTDSEVLHTIRDRYQLPERFVLSVGTLQPRKNFEGLVRSFARLMQHESSLINTLDLVIVGGKGWMYERLFAEVEQLDLGSRVHFTGFVADDDLPALYSAADAFAFPSWYEGFGLPVLEAMACGTPVVVADNSSLPEVVGDGGLLVSAADESALTDALVRVILDSGLRQKLVIRGLELARRFTWERAARQVLEVYHRVVAPDAGNFA